MSVKTIKKTISIITALVFLCTNTLYAAPSSRSLFKNKRVDYKKLSTQSEQRLQRKRSIFKDRNDKAREHKREAKRVLQTHLKDLSQIHIPSEYGRVIEVYDSSENREQRTENRLIVHIQDLHTNPEAELNLAKILEILLKDYNLDLVCSEGADGEVDTSSVSSFPDYEVREKVARLFIDSGELTGEEYLSITKYPDLPIWGIEDRDIYFKNIIQFNKIMKFSPSSQVFISQAKKALEGLKSKIYSRELQNLDQKETDYENEKIETDEYLKYLTSYIQKFNISTQNYKNITLLNEATEQEKNINQEKILQESQGLLLNLQAAISRRSLRHEMDSLMVKAQLFKEQKISPFSFYSYLKDLANKHLKDELSKYQNLNDFLDYLTKVNSLDTTRLFNEMEDLTYEAKQRLARTEEEKSLTKAIRNIKFLEGFFNLKVSNEELDYYVANKESHKVGWFKSAITNLMRKTDLANYIDFNPSLIDPHLQEIEDFYETVKNRDIAMVNNAVSEIEKRNARVAALISGGFHTKGITRMLREDSYSYIVVSPYSSTDIDEENYHFLLSGKRKPLSELIQALNSSLRVILAFVKDKTFADELEEILPEEVLTKTDERMLTVLPLGGALILARRTKGRFNLTDLQDKFTDAYYAALAERDLTIELKEGSTTIQLKSGDKYFSINKEKGAIRTSSKYHYDRTKESNKILLAKGVKPKRLASNQDLEEEPGVATLLNLKESGVTTLVVYFLGRTMGLDIDDLIDGVNAGQASLELSDGQIIRVETQDGLGRVVADIKKESMVLPYEDSSSEEVLLSGGKGAQLAKKRRQLGVVSPNGFNITTEANKWILLHNPELVKLIEEVKDTDVTDASKRQDLSRRIQNYIMTKAKLPSDLRDMIEKNIIKLSKELGYTGDEVVDLAYRGSGVIEDFTGEIPWFSKSIGAQPGQGTSVLHQKGLDRIRPATLEVLAGLFNDQIFVYRDIQIFFDFVSNLGEAQYKELIELCEKYNHKAVADLLRTENSPGYVRLSKVLNDIELKEEGVRRYAWLEKLEKSADEILNPFNLLTGVSVLEQIDSYVAGTGFTSDMATGFDGSTWAKEQDAFPGTPEANFKGYTRYINVNFGPGMGPGVVDGMFVPDIGTLFLPNKDGRWVSLGYELGSNEIAMVFLEKAFRAISHKYSEKKVRRLAALYMELGEETTKSKAQASLLSEFNISKGLIKDWITAMKDLWFYHIDPSKHKSPPQKKARLLKRLNLNESEFFTVAYIIKHINGIETQYGQLSYINTPSSIRSNRLVSDEGIQVLARMIEEVANIEGQDKAKTANRFDDRRDIEFALSLSKANDPNPYKFRMQAFDLVTGKPLGKRWFKWTHLQNRPINPEREASNPDDIIFKKKRVDNKFIEEHDIEPVAERGLVSFGVAEGEIYVVDPEQPLDKQETEITKLGMQGRKVIVILQQMGPEHDNIVRAASMYGGGALVWQGNNTSHAYIFSVEQHIPIVINPTVNPEYESYFKNRAKVILAAENGRIWPGDKGIPLIDDDFAIRVDLIPPTKAGIIASTPQSAQEIARLGAKSVLSRIEFFINEAVKIYPQAGEAYDNLIIASEALGVDMVDILGNDDERLGVRDRIASEGKAFGLTDDDINDIQVLLGHPEVIAEIRDTIKGYPSSKEFMAEKMRYISNFLGALFPAGDWIRAYDNKEKEALLYGLKGAELYLHYDDRDPRYDSPLVGLRGSALMVHPHYKKGFLHLNRGILRSIKDGFTNNSFFFVFVRTPKEVEIQLADLEKQCKEEGVYPKEIGVMIETPANVWDIDEIIAALNSFKQRNPEVRDVFISFGTNDWTKTTGKNSREDKDFTAELKVMDPALKDIDPEDGRIQVDSKGTAYGPKERGKPWILTIDDEAAPVMLRMAEHVVSRARKAGVITSLCGQLIFNTLAMGRFDVAAKFINILDSFGTQSKNYAQSAMLDYDVRTSRKVVKEEALGRLNTIAELYDTAQVGVTTGEVVYIDKPEDIHKIREGENKDKIVIIRSALGSKEDLEEQGLPWDYLRYARSILISPGVKEGLEISKEDIEIALRVKGKILTTQIRDGDIVTVDYNNKSVYRGEAPVDVIEKELQEITLPDREPEPIKRVVLEEDAARVAKDIGIHPLAFVGYKNGSEPVSDGLRERIGDLLNGKDPMEYLEDIFYEAMVKVAGADSSMIVVHNTFNLTRNELRELDGGEEIEKTKGREGRNFDDRYYRLYGGARNISDFSMVHRAELNAYKRAKKKHKNLRLQLTTMGVRSREIVEAQLRVLKDIGIDPEKDEVGLKLTTQADVLYIEGYTDGEGNYIKGYIDQGIRFFSYDKDVLAAAILPANLSHPDIFVTPSKDVAVKNALEKPLLYVHKAIEDAKERGVWLAVKEPPKATRTHVRISPVGDLDLSKTPRLAMDPGYLGKKLAPAIKRQVEKAKEAVQKGDLDEARRLYNIALASSDLMYTMATETLYNADAVDEHHTRWAVFAQEGKKEIKERLAELASNTAIQEGRALNAQLLQSAVERLSRVEGGIVVGVGLKDNLVRTFTPDGRFFTPIGRFTRKLDNFMKTLSDESVRENIHAGIMYYDIRSKFWRENPEFVVAFALAYAKKLQEKTGKEDGIVLNIGLDAYAKHFETAQIFVDTILRTGITDNGGGINYWGTLNGGDIRNYSQFYHAVNGGNGGNWVYFTMSHRLEDFLGAKMGINAEVFCGPQIRHCEGITSGTLYDYIVEKNFAEIKHKTPTGDIITVQDFLGNNIAVASDMIRATSAKGDVPTNELLKGAKLYIDMGGSLIGKNLVDMLIALGADVEVDHSEVDPNYNTENIIDPNEHRSAAIKRLREIAKKTGRVVLAVDPDGDRGSIVAVGNDGKAVSMTGSELLLVTIEDLANSYKEKGRGAPMVISDMRTALSADDLTNILNDKNIPIRTVPHEAGYAFFMRGMAGLQADIAVENTTHAFTSPMTNSKWGAPVDYPGYQGADNAALYLIYLLGSMVHKWEGRNPVQQLEYIRATYALKPTVVNERKPALPPEQDRYKYMIAERMKKLAAQHLSDTSKFLINFGGPELISGVHITNVKTRAMQLARFSNTGSSFTISGEGYIGKDGNRQELDEMLGLGYWLMTTAVQQLRDEGHEFDFDLKDAADLRGKFEPERYGIKLKLASNATLEVEGDLLSAVDKERLERLAKVNTVITETKEDAEQRAARRIADLIKSTQGEKVVIGFATGGTYEGIYAALIRITEKENISWENVVAFNLDEYVWQAYGYPKEYRDAYYDRESYQAFMYSNLFNWMKENAGLKEENIHLIDGLTNSPDLEAKFYEDLIMKETNGEGVDLQVLGIGVEGHIAFIEARHGMLLEEFLKIGTKDEELAPSTIEANSRFFDGNMDAVPTHAITQGISTTLKAKEILLVGTGSTKEEAIADTVMAKVTPAIPATILQLHKNATVIADRDAAQGLIKLAKSLSLRRQEAVRSSI